MSKVCASCSLSKPRTEFNKRSRALDGLNSTCKDCDKVAKAASYQRNKETTRKRRVAYKYGITWERVEDMYVEQGGECAVCSKRIYISVGDQNDSAHVDHCHATGKVRGLLCNSCNRAIGLLDDDPDNLEAAAAYLRKHVP